MKRSITIFFLLLWLAMFAISCAPTDERFPYRWVRMSRSLNQDSDVDEIAEIARVASEHGLNGMMLSSSFDEIDRQPPEYFARLARVNEICDGYGIEVIPIFLSVGYGSGLSHDENLAAGLPVKDALFIAQEGEAVLQPDQHRSARRGYY